MTQPRRVAATALAQRVSSEMKSPEPGKKGSEVGYVVRLDRAVADSAKIVYCTVGILLRMLVCPQEADDENAGAESDLSSHVPLSNITHIVVDEGEGELSGSDYAAPCETHHWSPVKSTNEMSIQTLC